MKSVCSFRDSRSEGSVALGKQPLLTLNSRISSASRQSNAEWQLDRESFLVSGKEALPTRKDSNSVAADE